MNATGSVNVNRRADFFTKNFADLNAKFVGFDAQRIISIALPFLALNSKIGAVSTLGFGLYHCFNLYSAEKTTTGNKHAELILFISSTAVSILFPTQHFILSNLIFFGVHFKDLLNAKDKVAGTKIVLQMISQAIHIASIHTKSPTSIVISLLTQAGTELIQAWNQFFDKKNAKKPEALASLLLAAIRLQKISTYMPHDFSIIPVKKEQVKVEPKHVEPEASVIEPEQPLLPDPPQPELPPPPALIETPPPVIEPEQPLLPEPPQPELPPPPVLIETPPPVIEPELPTLPELPPPPVLIEPLQPLIPNRGPQDLKEITQTEWNHLCEFITLNRGVKLHLSTLLKSRGFSLNLRNLNFTQLSLLQSVEFENITCYNCDFSNMTIRFCAFNNLTCYDCNFSKSNINLSSTYDFKATRCIFKEVVFDYTSISFSTFIACDFSLSSFQPYLFFAPTNTTFTDCIEAAWFTSIDKKHLKSGAAPLEELDPNPDRFKNPSSPFTDVDHDLSGDLPAKIDAKRVKIIDADNKEYDFGAYFHGYGKGLVKGANLQFRTITAENGTSRIELSFEMNEVYQKRLRHLIKGLKHLTPEEQQAFALQVQSNGLVVEKVDYPVGQEVLTDSLYKVSLQGFGSLMVGKKYVYSLRNQVKVSLGSSATIESFHHFLSVFGLEDAVKKSTEEDLERLKFGVLFKTFYPTQSHFMEKEGSFFTRPLEEVKQEIFNEFPKMRKIVEDYKVESKELFPGFIKYGTNVAGRAYELGARALTTALTSLPDELKEEDMGQVASILKNGLLSQEMRDKNGITIEGLNSEGHYEDGGSQVIYLQMIMKKDLLLQKNLDTFGYESPVRLYVSLEALNQGSYQSLPVSWGEKIGDEYLTRHTIFGFIKRDPTQFRGHEIMIPDRILPTEIKAMSVKSEEIKTLMISYLEKCGVIQDGMIHQIPVEEFIQVEDHITPDLVKRCVPGK